VEKITIYEEGELKVCPRCGADALDYEDAPTDVVCKECETHYTIKTVLFEK
jgi:hypothetical protein